MTTTNVYGYELPIDKRMELSEQVRKALSGIVAADRITQETEIIMCGTVYQIETILRGANI